MATQMPKIKPQDLLDTIVSGAKNAAGYVGNQITTDTQNNVNSVKKYVTQDLPKSAIGQAVQGKWGNVLPAIGNELTHANFQVAGEMGDVPGAGIDPETGMPKYPYTKSPSTIAKMGKGQNQDVRQIRFKGNQNAPALEDNANNTLDRLGVQGSAHEQLAQIPQKKAEIGTWIKNNSSMAKAPKDINISDIKDSITNEVKKQFGTKLTNNQIDQVVTDHMNNVYDRAQQDQQSIASQPEQTPNNPYFAGTSDMNPSTAKGTPTGQPLVRDMRYKQGNAEFKQPTQTAEPSAQPRFAYNNQETTNLPNQPNAVNTITPDKISSQSVYNMKVAANNSPEVASAFDKIMNGNRAALTDDEKTALAARDAYDKIIAKSHPDVKTATKDLSVLNNHHVFKSLESARFSPPPPKEPLNAIVPKAAQYFLPPIAMKGANKLITNPTALKVGAGIAGVGGLVGGGYLMGKQGQNAPGNPTQTLASGVQQQQPPSTPQQQTKYIHTSDIPQTLTDSKPDQNGVYSVVSPQNIVDDTGKPIALAGEAATQQANVLEGQLNKMKSLGMDNTPQYADTKTQYDLLQNKQQIAQKAQDAYPYYSQMTNLISDAQQRLKGAPVDLLANTSVAKLSSAFDGKYKQLATDLQTLDKLGSSYGILQSSLFNTETTGVALAALDQMGKQTKYNYYNQYINPLVGNVGSNSLTPGKPVQTQATPPAATKPQGKVSFYQPPATQQMPSIPTVQQMQQAGAQYAP